MLTVRNLLWDGNEDVVEVQRISTGQQTDTDSPVHPAPVQLVVWGHSAEGDITFTHGKVYVMNSNGKTVAVYDLGAPKNMRVEAGTPQA